MIFKQAESSPLCGSEEERSSCVPCNDLESAEDTEDDIKISDLPPLPDPDVCTMRSEACCGSCFVLCLILLFVFVAHAIGSIVSNDHVIKYIGLGAIYLEAIIAICCLLGVMWADPGVIRRSPKTCFPLPPEVRQAIKAGVPVDERLQLRNISDGRRSYCVRCLVWREDEECHHCSTCGRCVREFDHHCGVMGRCIAGDGFGGNMGFFKMLLSMAGAAIVTCIAFSLLASAHAPPMAPRPHRTSTRLPGSSHRYRATGTVPFGTPITAPH